eukprot:7427256-Heterocapsa_arctica.AAC.1
MNVEGNTSSWLLRSCKTAACQSPSMSSRRAERTRPNSLLRKLDLGSLTLTCVLVIWGGFPQIKGILQKIGPTFLSGGGS